MSFIFSNVRVSWILSTWCKYVLLVEIYNINIIERRNWILFFFSKLKLLKNNYRTIIQLKYMQIIENYTIRRSVWKLLGTIYRYSLWNFFPHIRDDILFESMGTNHGQYSTCPVCRFQPQLNRRIRPRIVAEKVLSCGTTLSLPLAAALPVFTGQRTNLASGSVAWPPVEGTRDFIGEQ